MKYKTSELIGELLNAAVATALKGSFVAYDEAHSIHSSSSSKRKNVLPAILNPGFVEWGGEVFEPSTNWAHGGPIVGHEQIDLYHFGREVLPSH